MIESKRKRLETKGWKIGSARDFLDLNDQEEAYIELRLKLADALKRQRISRNLTQEDLARAVSSSQSRVAKMEAGDASVSLDLLVRSLLAMGASNSDLAKIIAGSHARQKAA
ncbi:MAG: helix-turn-helix transcriptional regulator [Betaproteobacteria bacterium]|nr:helix-turn-helix transcriptional regulator [Betaproteobacteria bacterium]